MIPLEVVEALRDKTGLTVESLGEPAVQSALARGARDRGVTETRWAERVATEPGPLGELLEEVLVLESWFFRDRVPFEELARRAVARALPGSE